MENCFEQAESYLAEGIKRAELIAQRTEQVSEECRKQSEKLRKEFRIHKQKVISEILQAFEFYEQNLERMIGGTEDRLAQNLQKVT